MFCPRLVICFSWISLTFLLGYSITTLTSLTPRKPLATAAPVSPEVATNTVTLFVLPLLKYSKQRAIKRAPTSLNAMVGPWNSSRVDMFLLSDTIGKSKDRVSSIIFFRIPSGISGVTNCFIASKAISTSDRVSMFSKNDFDKGVVFSGKYSPLSSANPLITASLKDTSSAFLFKL